MKLRKSKKKLLLKQKNGVEKKNISLI